MLVTGIATLVWLSEFVESRPIISLKNGLTLDKNFTACLQTHSLNLEVGHGR